eukprot:NODE_2640_length_2174_cov_8.416219.p1 GENE.NODE_2640_length_2174_cov_8.416219~~NODE_2640_length_2174_cov_8.416219.p1  ORF type:complete len:627 (-),score=195.78 NODE_2640_length_2174_cov_8.416219:292-2106(-)
MTSPARGSAVRGSQAALSSALDVLADAAERHADDPGRLHSTLDRIAPRIRDTEDLFKFCPSHGVLPLGGGTIWGLICESQPIVAGVLIRKLLVERLGEELSLSERHQDAVLFAIDEHPRNVALFEVVGRCKALRATLGKRPDGLSRMVEALDTLCQVVQDAPSDRVDLDRGSVGSTSAVYGVCDSDAFFVEADLFRAALEVLLAPECQGWPSAAAGVEECSSSAPGVLRTTCVLVANIGGQLHAHPRVLARALVFLSSAVPLAFARRTPGGRAGADLWVMLHMLLSSKSGMFMEDVLRACSKSRMHDVTDLLAVQSAVFGHGRPGDDRRRGRVAIIDIRLTLCHTLLLLFQVLRLLYHYGGQPERFVNRVVALFRARFLPLLKVALEGPLANRWQPIREALAALITAGEQASPSASSASIAGAGGSGNELEWLRGASSVFRDFAVSRFLPTDGATTPRDAEQALDPFGHPAATAAGAMFAHIIASARTPSLAADTLKGAASPSANRAASVPLAASPREAASFTRSAPVERAPLGATPRRLGMQYVSLVEGTRSSRSALDFATPRQLNGAVFRATGASLARSALPPLGSKVRGSFFNASTAEYVH